MTQIRCATALLIAATLGLAGCIEPGGEVGVDATPPQTAEPDRPVFENETLKGDVTVTTFYVAAYVALDGFHYFDVASGTRTITMELSWSGSLPEIEMCAREDDYYAEDNCATTEGGEATLTISRPTTGKYQVRFFAETGATSGSYVIELQHEIWPDDEPSGNADGTR